MKILPHRDPMLLVDEVWVDEENCSHGHYTVRGDEFFLQGHFPGNPIVPGVILCEMMAQNCSLMFAEYLKGKVPLFSGLEKVRFKNPVKPGDRVEFVCRTIKHRGPFFFTEGEGTVDGKLCVKASMSFAIVDPEKV